MKKLLLLALVCLIARKGYTTDYNIRSLRTSTGISHMCGTGSTLTMIAPWDVVPVTGEHYQYEGTWGVIPSTVATINPTTGALTAVGPGVCQVYFIRRVTGESFTGNLTIADTTHPVITGYIVPNDHICVGGNYTFTSTETRVNLWKSSDPSKFSISSLPHFGPGTAYAPGTVNIIGGYSNFCGIFWGQKSVQVHPKPSVSLTASSRLVTSGHPITLTGNPVIAFPSLDTACAFEQVGGHVSLSATDISQPTVTYVNGGIEIIKFRYGIRYGGTGGAYCTNSASITITSSLHRGANGNEGENSTALAENLTGLKISPNPGKSLVTIEIPEIFETAQVIITDISGKVTGTSSTTEKTVAMDISQYPAGNYIINVFTGDKKYSEKVVKE